MHQLRLRSPTHPGPLPPPPHHHHNNNTTMQLEEKVADALSKGAVVAVGGQRPKWDAGHSLAGGFFYEPTVLTGGWVGAGGGRGEREGACGRGG